MLQEADIRRKWLFARWTAITIQFLRRVFPALEFSSPPVLDFVNPRDAVAGDALEKSDVGAGFRIEIPARQREGLRADMERDADRGIELRLVEPRTADRQNVAVLLAELQHHGSVADTPQPAERAEIVERFNFWHRRTVAPISGCQLDVLGEQVIGHELPHGCGVSVREKDEPETPLVA